MFDFRKSISFFPKFDVESSKFPAKSGSWKNPSRSHMTILSVIICVECVKSDELSVCQALVHFVNLRAKFVHWPKNVGLPIRARYKHFKTICDHIFDSWRQFLLLEMMIIQAKSWNFVQLLSFLCASSQYLPTCFCAWPSVSEDHATVFAWDFPTLETFLSCSSRNTWFEHFSVFIDNYFIRFAFTLSTSKTYIVKIWCRLSQMYQFLQFLPHIIEVLLSSMLFCHPRTQTRTVLAFDAQNKHSRFGTVSPPSSNRTSSNCLSHKRPASWCRYKFRSRRTTASSILDHDFGNLCRGKRIHLSGHSDFGILSNLGASSIFTGV